MERWDEAIARLMAVTTAGPGAGHPFLAVSALPDLAEAAARTGKLDAARAASARFVAYAQAGAPGWAAAVACRCRALVADDADEARGLFTEAMRIHARERRTFDSARTELLLGELLRRHRHRADARVALRAALNGFEQLAAAPWAERARRELRATGETARKRDPSAFAELTAQEVQITRLVAEGATNKNVAAQLFLSPRTVEYHLGNVFVKLGIASRAELIRLRVTGPVPR